jgi:DNA-binding beta-propeller fold protein YncE
MNSCSTPSVISGGALRAGTAREQGQQHSAATVHALSAPPASRPVLAQRALLDSYVPSMQTILLEIAFLSLVSVSATPAHEDVRPLVARPMELPGGAPVTMDYLAYDRSTNRVWIPAGNTGRVDVLDPKTGKVDTIDGFETEKRTVERDGKSIEVTVGPSSASAGDGVVYVGNRAGNRICAVTSRTLERKGCVQLASLPDGIAYVAATKQIWVTTPRTNELTILDASSPEAPKLIEGDGRQVSVDAPEGFAIDNRRGIFYTNIEEKDRTVSFDARTRRKVGEWDSGCGKEGPRGLSIDPDRQLLFVACGAGGVVVHSTRDGKRLGHIDTSGGVDNIDYLPEARLLYIASSKNGVLTIAHATETGQLELVGSAATASGARTVIVDKDGNAYVADSTGGKIWVVKRPPGH